MRWGGELIVTMCSADQSVVHRWRQQFDVLWHRDVVTGRHGRRPPARRQWSRSKPATDVRCWASTAERPLRRRRRLSAADRRRLPRPARHHRTLRRRSSVFTTRSSRSPGKMVNDTEPRNSSHYILSEIRWGTTQMGNWNANGEIASELSR